MVTEVWLIRVLRFPEILTTGHEISIERLPFGQNTKDDCKACDYGLKNHFDAATQQCVKR
jgi:hypothetical protein